MAFTGAAVPAMQSGPSLWQCFAWGWRTLCPQGPLSSSQTTQPPLACLQVTGWITNQVKSFEHSVAERALLYMLQDHPDAQRLCQNKFFSTDGKIEVRGLHQAADH